MFRESCHTSNPRAKWIRQSLNGLRQHHESVPADDKKGDGDGKCGHASR